MTDNPPPVEDRDRIEARLRRMVERWPQVSGCHLNPDAAVVESIIQVLVRSTLRYGYPYCPCRDVSGDPEQDRAIMCPCQYHREEIRKDGHCRCVLFVGDDFDPEKAYRPLTGDEPIPAARCVRHRSVTVYSTPWCFHSRRAKGLLESQDVAYKSIDIDKDIDAALRVESWTGGYRSVPTICARLIITEPSIAEIERILQTPEMVLESLDLYMTQWCFHSRRTVRRLEEQGFPVRLIDIERDPEAARRVQEWNNGYMSVPTLDVNIRLTEPSGDNLIRALGL